MSTANDQPASSAQGVVLVTGAAGFIGSHVSAALLRGGHRVVGVDNFDPFYPRDIKHRNLRRIEIQASGGRSTQGSFEFIEGDIIDEQSLIAALEGRPLDGVIHLAARAGVRPSIDDPVGYAHANVTATACVLQIATKLKARRVVIASSSSVYGDNTKAPFREDADVSQPISPYAATKRACELMGYTHWHLTKMPTAMLRFFTVYGPGQRPDLAISQFMRKAMNNEEITLFGDLSTSRDYTYIDDIVAGVIAAYQRIDRFGYRVWNLGNSSPVTLGRLIESIGTVAGRALRTRNLPGRPGDVQHTYASLDRARQELDYTPSVEFLKGLQMQWEDLRSQQG